jgi:hypothetical protein
VTFPAEAGTSVAYDNRIWHNAMPNTSSEDRRCLICSCACPPLPPPPPARRATPPVQHRAAERGAAASADGPYGTGQSGQVVSNAKRLYAAGRLGTDQPKLRQLLGFRLGLAEIDYNDPRHLSFPEQEQHEQNPTPDNR